MNKNVTPIKPTFKHNLYLCMQTLTNFPFIEDDFDALTNYELLCKVVEYLNQISANDNTQNEVITQLANAFNELVNYINNYFDNLDVQEEINNKLDEMASSGELTNLIKEYVDPIYQAYEEEINTDISNFKTQTNNSISDLRNEVESIASGTPMPASSTSDMTDTTKLYVNTTDGYVYYYNGNNWVQGWVYQATEDSDSVEDNTESIGNEFHLTNDILTDEGKYLTNNGTTGNAATYNTSDYIPVNENQKIILNSCSRTTGLIIAFYNRYRQFISGETSNVEITRENKLETTTPQNTKFIRISNNVSTHELNGFITLSSIIKTINSELNQKKYNDHKNTLIFNNEILKNVGYINSSGQADSTITSFGYSDFIRCDNIRKIKLINASRNTGLTISYYFGDKTFISGETLANPILSDTEFNIPSTASYLRFSSNNTQNFYATCEILKTYDNKMSKASDIASDIVFGQTKIALIGDSITAGQGSTGYVSYNYQDDDTTIMVRGNGPDYPQAGPDYQTGQFLMSKGRIRYYEAIDGNGWGQKLVRYLSTKFPDSIVKNYGMAGIDSSDLVNFMPTLVNDYDIIIFMVGTNDRQNANLLNVYNNIYSCINTLLNLNKKVILMCSIPASSSNESQLVYHYHMEDIRHMYSKLSKQLSIPLIDLYDYFKEYCDYKNISIENLLTDGLHPNDNGYTVMFKYICKELGLSYYE